MEDMVLLLQLIAKTVIVRIAAAAIGGAIVGGALAMWRHGLNVARIQQGMLVVFNEGAYLGAIWGCAVVAKHNIVWPVAQAFGLV